MATTTGVFKTRNDAEMAITQLEATGISESQISLVMTDSARMQHFGLTKGSKVEEGVTVGGTAGGLIGAVTASVLAAGALAIPGLNLVVVGALVPALAGLGGGAVAGGLIGGLIGSGFPEHEAKLYDKEIKGGSVLVAVETQTSEEKKNVDRIFESLEKNTANNNANNSAAA